MCKKLKEMAVKKIEDLTIAIHGVLKKEIVIELIIIDVIIISEKERF